MEEEITEEELMEALEKIMEEEITEEEIMEAIEDTIKTDYRGLNELFCEMEIAAAITPNVSEEIKERIQKLKEGLIAFGKGIGEDFQEPLIYKAKELSAYFLDKQKDKFLFKMAHTKDKSEIMENFEKNMILLTNPMHNLIDQFMSEEKASRQEE